MDELPTAVDEFIEAVKKLKQDSDRKEAVHKEQEKEWKTKEEDLQARMDALTQTDQRKLEQMMKNAKTIKGLQDKIEELNNSLKTSEVDIKSLEKQLETQGGALKKVSNTLREKTRSFAESKKAWEDDAKKRNNLETKVQSQRQVIDELSKEKQNLSTQNKNMETAMSSQLDKFTRTNKDLQRQVAQLKSQIQSLTEENEFQKSELTDTVDMAKQARSETKAQKSQNVELAQKILLLEKKIKELEADIERLVAENKEHQKDLKECLEVRKKFELVEAQKEEQKKAEEEQKKAEEQKQKRLERIKKRLANSDKFKGGPRNPRRRTSEIRAPRVRGPQVRKMVLRPKDVTEEIAKLTNREFSLRKKNANVQALLKAIKGRLKDKRPVKDDKTNKKKNTKQVEANLKKINSINKQIEELKNIEDYNFIDEEIRHIQTAIENNRQRWENLKNQTEAQQMLKDTKKIIKSYEYNKIDSQTVNIGGRNVKLKEREIESPRIKEFNNALEKLSVDDAKAFFERVLNQNKFPKGTFSRLLDEARAEKDNPQEADEQTDRLDSFIDPVPDRGINAGGFQIRLRF